MLTVQLYILCTLKPIDDILDFPSAPTIGMSIIQENPTKHVEYHLFP